MMRCRPDQSCAPERWRRRECHVPSPNARCALPRRGAVAVAAVVLMILVNLVIVGMVLVGARYQDLTTSTIETTRAFYGAEAAMHLALRELSQDEDFDGSGDTGGIDPISPAAFRGITAGVDIETNGNVNTLSAWGGTARVHRHHDLTVSLQAGGGTGYPGLLAYYYRVDQPLWALDHVDWDAAPDAAAVTPNIDWDRTSDSEPFWIGGPNYYYGARFIGWINVPQPGTWTFETRSDDGSILLIDGDEVVSNDGLHSMRTRSGTVDLEGGWHEFEVRFFENRGRHGLIVRWQGPGVPSRTTIPPSAFGHSDSQRLQPVAGVAARTTINMPNSTVIDAFDSSTGAYGGGNVLTNAAYVSVNSTDPGAIDMWSGGTIYGHARVGPGGDPDTGIVPAHANITGTRGAFASKVTVPQIILSGGIPGSAGYFSLWGNRSETFASNFRFSGFSMSNNSRLTITEPIVGRVDGPFTLSNNSRIELADDAHLTLYLYGSLNMSNNTRFNDNTGDPSRVTIYLMNGGGDVNLSNNAQLAASIIAPESRVNVNNQTDMYGSVFSQRVHMSVGGAIHVDRRTIDIDDAGGGLLVQSWDETAPSP